MESLQIRDESGRLTPMKFSTSQEILWNFIAPQLDSKGKLWFIVLKGRQVYATTLFSALTFVRSVEQANTNSLIIGQDLFSSENIFGMAKRFWEHLPLPKLKPSKVKELEFPFPNGSSRLRVVSAGNIAKGRGTTQTCVHATEVAFWPQPEVIIGLSQAIPDLPDTMWVMESTANGMAGIGKMFYDYWKAAVDGRSQLTPIFIPWFIMPKYRSEAAIAESDWDDEEKLLVDQYGQYGLDGHTLAWRRNTIETKCYGSLDYFRQEYPTTPREAFIASGVPAFEQQAILFQDRHVRKPKLTGTMNEQRRFLPQHRGWLSVWQEPEDNHKYAIGVDTSEGKKGGDFGCAQVIDMRTMEQVAVMHGLLDPWTMAQQLNQLGRWYNNAVLAVELAGTGRAVQDYLIRIYNYPNLHVWKGRQDQIRSTGGKLFGWSTNVLSRPLLIEAGRRAINTRLAIIHDESTLEEASKFSRADSGKYEAESGHDDRVLALLIALRSREENYSEVNKLVLSPEYSLSPGQLVRVPGAKVIHSSDDVFLNKQKLHQAHQVQRARTGVKHWTAM